MPDTTTPVPPGYSTPPFPSLYWLVGPSDVVRPAYLYHIRDVWRFTLFWTLIVFEAAHLAAGTYAVTIVWLGSREKRRGLGMGRLKTDEVGGGSGRIDEKDDGEETSKKRKKVTKVGVKGTGISGMWAVPVVYGIIAGVDGVLAGSVVGLLLGALYNAGGFRMSTWIPGSLNECYHGNTSSNVLEICHNMNARKQALKAHLILVQLDPGVSSITPTRPTRGTPSDEARRSSAPLVSDIKRVGGDRGKAMEAILQSSGRSHDTITTFHLLHVILNNDSLSSHTEQDVMNSIGMIYSPTTPTRAQSAGPTSPHRSPMEDADSSSTRKRPRLDSGERTYRSMSADRMQMSPSEQQSTTTREDSESSTHIINPPPPFTPTKVTINVREPALGNTSPMPTTELSDQSTLRGRRGGEPSPPQHFESPRIESVHSSPTNSPEIQVAEVEDISDEPAVTRWRPIKGRLSEARHIQQNLLYDFPFQANNKTLRRTVNTMAATWEKNSLADTSSLEKVAAWIEAYLDTTHDLVEHWWDLFLDERDFWEDLPNIADAILRRSDLSLGTMQVLPLENSDSFENDDPLTKFLSAWAALALRMAAVDKQTLEDTVKDPTPTPDLASERYLGSFLQLINIHAPFWKCTVDTSRYDLRGAILAMIIRFTAQPADGIRCLAGTSKAILERPTNLAALIPKYMAHFWIPMQLAQHYRLLPAEDSRKALLSFMPLHLYEYFGSVNSCLQVLISKQVSGLSIGFCQNLVSVLSNILLTIGCSDEELTRHLCEERGLADHGLPVEERADLLQLSWKLDTLKKCIVEGRMEIRAQGVDSMSQELVQKHKKYVESRISPIEHPIARFLAEYLINNKLVQYLVGAESHPQLMQRSHNIIGFLVVTGRLTNADTDTIWKAVATSYESRSGEAILNMLSQCLNLCGYSTLLYLVEKLNETPVHAFDGKMMNFATRVIDCLRQKWEEESLTDAKLDMPPFDFYIRLIRQSAPDRPDGPENGRAVHDWAVWKLRHLLSMGPSDQAREQIFMDCLQDISDPKLSATGSISAITQLLGIQQEDLIRHLARDMNLTSILVNDLSRMVGAGIDLSLSPGLTHERLAIRLSLLYLVILLAPETIDSEAALTLWDTMVGSRAIDDSARDAAWDTLINVARHSRTRNPYIDLCISQLLPSLHSCYLVPGCLAFADTVRQYYTQTAESRSPGEQLRGPTAAELMWHLSLSVPSGKAGMEHRAISMLVGQYLDSPDAHQRSREANDSLHVELVERCINQLTTAASKFKAFNDGTSNGEDEPMVIIPPDDEVEAQKLSFMRSLMILKDFVRGVRSRPMYSPPPQTPSKLPKGFEEIRGDPITIKYQAFSEGRKNTDISTFEVGGLETVNDLSRKLKALTRFSNFTAIAGGQRLDFESIKDRKLQDLNFPSQGLLLIRKAPNAGPVLDFPGLGLRPMEVEILRHFDDLYRLLGMEESLARLVYDFLIAFPPHSSITSLVCSLDVSLEEAFPPSAPFKILYSVHALKLSLSHQLQTRTPAHALTPHGVNILAKTLTNVDLNVGEHGSRADFTVAEGLVDCLAAFLKAARDSQSVTGKYQKAESSPDVVVVQETASLLPEPEALIDRCISLISQASTVSNNLEADTLVYGSFSVILEGSLLSPDCWSALKATGKVPWLLKKLLLEQLKESNRQVTAKTIRNICRPSSRYGSYLTCFTEALILRSSASTPVPDDFIAFLWKSVDSIIPQSTSYGENSEQFFDVASTLLGSLTKVEQESLNIAKYVQDWSSLLLSHHHSEFVGRNEVDFYVLGLARLLVYCFQLVKSLVKPLDTSPDLMQTLFHTHLFPDLFDSVRIPNLYSKTREELYAILLALANDHRSYKTLLLLVKSLTAQGGDGSQAWSWGIAQTAEDCTYEANWNFERVKAIRAPVGYPGLRNLSNTCYMNSLFAQLFMNLEFRTFILNANVADSGSSQRLLHETQTLFGFMQESTLRSVDTQNVADSIVTYENTAVDVTYQVDVDEFYNLLFDRWESQILSESDKNKFRRFFGGQIVQQIKSKECSHISETLEPFSAIQCDISGKNTLIESLNAYVHGEAMEGDNKYSCTSCGRYVDAVKRACLKDVPHNLIFHLKRFDYDLMHGTRTKINDRFEFPMEVDMAPYNVDYLKDPGEPPAPDIFALVGVLVHSGTAESGHYYSYIQERPALSARGKKWVEFNDTDVTEFNPANIDDQCFGGWTRLEDYQTPFVKPWNAYMLFYERVDTTTGRAPRPSAPATIPAKSPLPSDLRERIAVHNQAFLRQYCLHDPAYAVFAKSMLKQLRSLYGAQCSDDHFVEKEAIWLALEHLDKVSARTKETIYFDEMLTSLTRSIGSCSVCCKLALQWVKEHDYPLHDLLLRCPHAKVRKEFASMIILTLEKLRLKETFDYGFVESPNGEPHPAERGHELSDHPATFYSIAYRLRMLWDNIYLHTRAWDDYFGLLAEMANMGAAETHVLLRLGFLQCCLELLICDHPNIRHIRQRAPYTGYIRMLEKGRKIPMTKLVEFIANLFERIDFQEDFDDVPCENRRFDVNQMSLTHTEHQYIHFRQASVKGICHFLDRILNSASNPLATRRIVRSMVLAEPRAKFHPIIQNTIRFGINIDPACLAAPFLRVALTYCEYTHSILTAERLVTDIASEVHTIGQSGGREHLEFFAQARRLRNVRNIARPDCFNRLVLTRANLWAPQLLMYWEDDVRNGTVELLKILLFDHDINNMDDEELADQLRDAGRKLCIQCAKRCQMVLEEGKPVGKTAEQIIVVVNECLGRYFSEDEEGIIRDAQGRCLNTNTLKNIHAYTLTDIIARLSALTVCDIDDQASGILSEPAVEASAYSDSAEWPNGSDDLPTDSDSEGGLMGTP
ncbi:MAG: hypothetical protein Q9163_002630 [Psora crenata]